MENHILEMQRITKDFPGVRALDDVNFSVERGKIHAIVGENGAGKSTLMKILSGVYPTGTFEGKILINGVEKEFKTIKDSEKAGITIIYQELALVNQLSVCENLFLGNEIASRGLMNWSKAYIEAENALKEVGLELNPATKIYDLGVGQQQLVEIAKAIAKHTDILILDEPTASLTRGEVENLFQILRQLKAKGVTCIYISHKLYEVFEIADFITVLRDGKSVGTKKATSVDEHELITMMVGRELNKMFPREEHQPGEVVLEVKNWSVHDPEIPDRKLVDNVSFVVRRGEILGLSGLMGSGRTELAMSLIGALGTHRSGEILLNGKPLDIRHPADAIRNGLSYLSEDRKESGLVLMMSIKDNITLASLDRISNNGVINENEEIRASEEFVNKLRIKCASIEQQSNNLSGGNQQKVALGKWLMTKPEVLILDEPTRGIDVGAKVEIFNIMNDLVKQDVCVLMISSELPEILGMSDRILVMHEGKIAGEFDWKEATQEKVMYCSTGRGYNERSN